MLTPAPAAGRPHRIRSLRRWLVAAVLAAGALGPGALGYAPAALADDGGGESIGVSVPFSGTIACADLNGATVTAGSTLRHGDTLFCTIDGLAPGARVSAAFASPAGSAGSATTRADGTAALDITVPATLEPGKHKVAFTSGSTTLGSVGFALEAGAATEPTADGTSSGGSDSGSSGGARGGSGGAGTDADSTSRDPALTGVDVLGLCVLAAALIGGGGLLTVLGRRRRAERFAA